MYAVHAATQKGLIVQFGHSCCWIKDASGKVVGKGRHINRMYQLNCEANIQAGSTPSAEVHQSSTAKDDSSSQINLRHHRLAHLNENQLTQAVKKGLIKGVDTS